MKVFSVHRYLLGLVCVSISRFQDERQEEVRTALMSPDIRFNDAVQIAIDAYLPTLVDQDRISHQCPINGRTAWQWCHGLKV